jgi:diguanylate cyclase (GGDEF)-like protein
MSFPTRLTALAPHWRRREHRDAIVIVAIAFLAYVAGTAGDFALILFRFGIDNADWEADDIIFVILVVGIAMTVYGSRRYRDLARETKARIDAEQEASSLARHDPLTALPNRRMFEEKLEEHLHGVGATHRMAVLMLDLDGFKAFNDTYGHAVGDKALNEFAGRVSKVLCPGALFARIGGARFAIIEPKICSLEESTNLARRVAAAVAEPFLIENIAAEFGVGIGISVAPGDGINPDELIRRADRALCHAKAAGRSTVRFFEPDMDAHIERRIHIERELRCAISVDILEPYYQPLVSLKDECIIGFEALARWDSKALGPVPPDVFIPIAEETGLIGALGNQLLRRACLDARTWPETFFLAVKRFACSIARPYARTANSVDSRANRVQFVPSGDRNYRERYHGKHRRCAGRDQRTSASRHTHRA